MSPRKIPQVKASTQDSAPASEEGDRELLKPLPFRMQRFGVIVWTNHQKVQLTGYWTINDLIGRLNQSNFAFEDIIVRCLLFIAALERIPQRDLDVATDKQKKLLEKNYQRRLVGVARALCGLVHFHAKSSSSKRVLARHGIEITDHELNSLDSNFFSQIGGPESLLFAPNVEDLFVDINQAIDRLMAPLAVAHYFDCLGWTHHHASRRNESEEYLSTIKRLATLRCAYGAVSRNAFGLSHGFNHGPFHKERAGSTPYQPRSTARPGDTETVRTRVRDAPPTIMVLYQMLGWGVSIADDWAVPSVFMELLKSGSINRRLHLALATSKRNILPILENKNHVVPAWLGFSEKAGADDRRYQRPPLSPEEIEKLCEIVDARRRGRPPKGSFRK